MQVFLYELKTGSPLELIANIKAVTIETVTAEIQILNFTNNQGEQKAREIDASRLGIQITE